MIPALDISQYQGAWQDYPCGIVLIKMSGGDDGLYMDKDAATNYGGAIRAGKAVGGYHFIGWTLGAAAEATYFLQAMSPLAENDVYALDVESIPGGVNPVTYVQEMVDLIHSHINVWPLVYMNLSTLNAYDWDSVLINCGLWLADWAVSPDQNIPTLHTYVMQQYSDGPSYDHDEWFGPSVDSFKAYGVKLANVPSTAPVSTPTPPLPVPVVVPTPTPTPPVTAPVIPAAPSPAPTPGTSPVTPPTPVTPAPKLTSGSGQGSGTKTEQSSNWLTSLINLIKKLFKI